MFYKKIVDGKLKAVYDGKTGLTSDTAVQITQREYDLLRLGLALMNNNVGEGEGAIVLWQ